MGNAFVAVVASLVAAANAGVAPLAGAPLVGAPLVAGKTLVRAPAHDSASIANHRLGGNFAYAVQTAEAFAEVTPKIAHQTIPIAEHTNVKQPIYKTRTYHQTHQVVNTVAQPAVAVGTTAALVGTVAHAAPAVAAVAAPAIAAPAVGAIAAPAVGIAGAGYAGLGLGGYAAVPAGALPAAALPVAVAEA